MRDDVLTVTKILQRIHEQGLRLTLPRKGIIEVLHESDDYLSADEIYRRVHKKYSKIGLATIYRTLILLTDIGVLTKFEFGEGKARYELAESTTGERHHHILVCTSCQKVIKYSDFTKNEKECMDNSEKHLESKYKFSIVRHIVQFYGLCKDCR